MRCRQSNLGRPALSLVTIRLIEIADEGRGRIGISTPNACSVRGFMSLYQDVGPANREWQCH
jgi:hypothetical protein